MNTFFYIEDFVHHELLPEGQTVVISKCWNFSAKISGENGPIWRNNFWFLHRYNKPVYVSVASQAILFAWFEHGRLLNWSNERFRRLKLIARELTANYFEGDKIKCVARKHKKLFKIFPELIEQIAYITNCWMDLIPVHQIDLFGQINEHSVSIYSLFVKYLLTSQLLAVRIQNNWWTTALVSNVSFIFIYSL